MLPVFCSDLTPDQRKEIEYRLEKIEEQLESIQKQEQNRSTTTSNNQDSDLLYGQEPSYNGYGVELRTLEKSPEKSEFVFHDSGYSVQFVNQVYCLLEGSLGKGKYAGGRFMTTYKTTGDIVYCKTTPAFWREIKNFVESKKYLIQKKTDLVCKEEPVFTNAHQATGSIYKADPRILNETTETEEALNQSKSKILTINSIRDFNTVLETTTLISLNRENKSGIPQFNNSLYKSGILYCQTGEKSIGMGADRVNEFRMNDWQDIHKLPQSGNCLIRQNKHVLIRFSRGFWLQMDVFLKQTDKNVKAPNQPKQNRMPRLPEVVVTVGAASLATYVAFKFKSNIPQTASLLFEKFLKPVDIFAQSCGTIVTNKLSEKIADFTNKRLITKK